jgi:hypothetical protein
MARRSTLNVAHSAEIFPGRIWPIENLPSFLDLLVSIYARAINYVCLISRAQLLSKQTLRVSYVGASL